MFKPVVATVERPDVVPASSKQRSALANRSKLHRDGDGRSATARRFRDLLDDLVRPFGGIEAIGELDLALCRAVAAKMVENEDMQARLARGEDISAEDSVRLANSLARLLAQLEQRRKALATPTPVSPLADYLANLAVKAAPALAGPDGPP